MRSKFQYFGTRRKFIMNENTSNMGNTIEASGAKSAENATNDTRVNGVTADADEVNSATSTKNGEKVIDYIISMIAGIIASLARQQDGQYVRTAVLNVLRTICEMNASDRYAVGIRVSGELYRFGEYELPASLAQLVCAASVQVNESPTAFDVSDHESWKATKGKVLTPGEVTVAINSVASKIRKNPNRQTVSRVRSVTLQEATNYAVYGRRLPNKSSAVIYFLRERYDEEAHVSLTEWCQEKSEGLFD